MKSVRMSTHTNQHMQGWAESCEHHQGTCFQSQQLTTALPESRSACGSVYLNHLGTLYNCWLLDALSGGLTLFLLGGLHLHVPDALCGDT